MKIIDFKWSFPNRRPAHGAALSAMTIWIRYCNDFVRGMAYPVAKRTQILSSSATDSDDEVVLRQLLINFANRTPPKKKDKNNDILAD